MATSSEPKSGIAKAITFFAIFLLMCLGLCGLNALVISISPKAENSVFLLMTAFFETVGIVVGLAGLVLFGIFGIINAIYLRVNKPSTEDDRP